MLELTPAERRERLGKLIFMEISNIAPIGDGAWIPSHRIDRAVQNILTILENKELIPKQEAQPTTQEK